jgi:threonine synthase
MICPKCNGWLFLEFCLTDKYIKSSKFKSSAPTVWKYLHNLIPFYSDTGHDNASQSIVSLNEGGTPLRISNIGTKLNLRSLRIKDETRNPTTTFMDRGTTAEISMCRLLGSKSQRRLIVGNVVGSLAVSLAAYSARAAFECQLFVQKNQAWGLSPNILYQLISYGSKINLASNNLALAENHHKFNYNNTFFVEGLKTTGFEICDQLGWELPDHIVVPMGRGTHLYAIHRSILEMISLGLVKNCGNKNKKVAIHGVTLENNLPSNTEESRYNDITNIINTNSNSNTIPLEDGLSDKSNHVATIAPELVPPGPSYLEDAVSVVHNTGGSIVKVSDNDLINAVSLLASHDGILASPAGASSVAGLLKLIESNLIEHDENIVCIVTMSEGSITDSIKNWKALQAYSRLRHHEYQTQKILNTMEKGKKNTSNNDDDDPAVPLGKSKRKILLLLKEHPDYTYNLRKRLIKKYSISLDISTLYQHLNELEKKGAILRSKAESFRGKPIRFYYNITPVGNTLVGHI